LFEALDRQASPQQGRDGGSAGADAFLDQKRFVGAQRGMA
jgi:hypothetical protein